MVKTIPVIIGFILAVIVKSFFGNYEFIGLLAVGFIVGYIAKEGLFGGMLNAAVAGSLGTIVSAVLFILVATFGGSLFGMFGGLVGFTISGVYSLISVIGNIIYYAIVMGITGAVGGALAKRN
ncbi:MAG: DUF5518 domain-containing protein [Methanobacteriaceae archaeon]|jgi:hypothetical protein|nr:DUF5518 domain-containing protein [Methanobacteriaceae archaeon]